MVDGMVYLKVLHGVAWMDLTRAAPMVDLRVDEMAEQLVVYLVPKLAPSMVVGSVFHGAVLMAADLAAYLVFASGHLMACDLVS